MKFYTLALLSITGCMEKPAYEYDCLADICLGEKVEDPLLLGHSMIGNRRISEESYRIFTRECQKQIVSISASLNKSSFTPQETENRLYKIGRILSDNGWHGTIEESQKQGRKIKTILFSKERTIGERTIEEDMGSYIKTKKKDEQYIIMSDEEAKAWSEEIFHFMPEGDYHESGPDCNDKHPHTYFTITTTHPQKEEICRTEGL